MSLTPTQLQELQTIVLDLGEEFPHNADALWNAAIRIQTGGLGPTSGAGGQPAFDAAVADIKVCQEEVQTYQQRQGSPSSGFDVAVLQVVPATSTFPSGNVGEILYLETAPNSYIATDQIVITPLGPNSVQLDEVGTTVVRTVPAASGGLEINNLSTGAGFERALTTADLVVMGGQVDTVVGGTNINVDAGDPINPIVNLDAAITGVSVNGVTLSAAGAATDYLDETGAYSVPPGGAPIVGTGVVIPTAGTPYDYDAQFEFQNANLLQTATVGWNGTSNFQVRSVAREALVELVGTDTGGVERTLFSGDPDGAIVFRYAGAFGGGFQVSAPDSDHQFRLQPFDGVAITTDYFGYNDDNNEWEFTGDINFQDGVGAGARAIFGIDINANGESPATQSPFRIANNSNHGTTTSGHIYFTSDIGANRGLFIGRQFFAENLTDKGASQFGAVFDTDTSMITDPGLYNLRFDNATPASVTEISIDDTGIGGHDFGDYWGAELVSGDQLFIKQVDDDTRWIIFTLTGPPVDQTGFWTIPVSVNSSGVLPVDTEEINVAVFSSSLGGGQVNSVVGGTNISVNVADPINPIVNLDAAITGVSVNGVTLTAAGAATNFLNETGAYSVPPAPATPTLQAVVAAGPTTTNDIEIITGASLSLADSTDTDIVTITIEPTTLAPAHACVFAGNASVEAYQFDELINCDGTGVHLPTTGRFALYRAGDSVSNFFSNTGGELGATSVSAAFRMNAISLRLPQQTSPDTNVASWGQIWIDNQDPTRLRYTDDLDNDFVVAMSGGFVGENVTVNNSFDFNTAGNFADNWIGQYFDGGNDTLTLEDSTSTTNWPLYTTINIIAPGSGVLTVTEGSGVTLFNADGSDTVGGVTISQGVASITRQTSANYIVWGSGIT